MYLNVAAPSFGQYANAYAQSRAGYPGEEIIKELREEYHFDRHWTIADLGTGTGLSSIPFLKNGNCVLSIDHDGNMLEKGENLSSSKFWVYERIQNKAERTSFRDHIADLIVIGTAFHWFDVNKAKEEFQRILTEKAVVVLVWNLRDSSKEGFTRDYENALLRHSEKYNKLFGENRYEDSIKILYGPETNSYKRKIFSHSQEWDKKTLENRVCSSAWYSDELLADLNMLFDHYQKNNTVTIEYATYLYHGRLV